MRKSRTKINPLAQHHEERLGDLLDEVHRLVCGFDHGCVCMPHGLTEDGNGYRSATDEECRYATISVAHDLEFDISLSSDGCAESAADALERFAADISQVAEHVRSYSQRVQALKARRA